MTSALREACDTDDVVGPRASQDLILDEARSAYRVGLCIVPAAADGTKRPDVPTRSPPSNRRIRCDILRFTTFGSHHLRKWRNGRRASLRS